jgi:hypothetical protein
MPHPIGVNSRTAAAALGHRPHRDNVGALLVANAGASDLERQRNESIGSARRATAHGCTDRPTRPVLRGRYESGQTVTSQNCRVPIDANGTSGNRRTAIEAAIVASWDADTRYASDRYMAHGRPGDAARGQCGATALVVQDFLGGDLIVGDVLVGSERLGVHYWNRLEDGETLDLTAGQFVDGEVVTDARTIHRPQGLPTHGAEAYLRLRERVVMLLAAEA